MINNTQDAGSAAALFASLNATSGSAANASAAASTQDRFLKLLVTQMKNQNPLNPMDNAQVTSQMAQLSTVTGIDKLNVTLQALSDSMVSNQSLQAATMIGHGVLVPGKGVDLSNGSGYGGIEMTESADKVGIAIYDKGGALVRNINLGAQSVGLVNWQWDGRDNSGIGVADGSYTFAVEAIQAGNKVDATALQFGMVHSVTQGKQGVALGVGQLDGVALSQVRQIL
ncbi:flagellar hook assembly protein FlgD [Candidatus Ferrigenium straubiae]|jgi:flagellar basal-body rod modification protein FlgD|uniref:flagellar hook assembly protein FlgD n=1 Tax=Candidatus Ferrigenium straubiae TaxID=2919506 RepID=UPI003F4ACA6F